MHIMHVPSFFQMQLQCNSNSACNNNGTFIDTHMLQRVVVSDCVGLWIELWARVMLVVCVRKYHQCASGDAALQPTHSDWLCAWDKLSTEHSFVHLVLACVCRCRRSSFVALMTSFSIYNATPRHQAVLHWHSLHLTHIDMQLSKELIAFKE